jgi:predicted signal transduction protein with EAL and GGDEF domain
MAMEPTAADADLRARHRLADGAALFHVLVEHAVIYGVAFSWLIGGIVSGVLALVAGCAMHQLSVSRAEFERLSRTDMLSGLLNRRAFTEALDDCRWPACLAIFDVDRFKAINDRLGTPAAMR